MKAAKKQIKVVLLAFRQGDKILLNRRADADSEMWEFIGGGIESGETPEAAIIREVKEELGYSLSKKADTLTFVGELLFEDHKIIANAHIFTARLPQLKYFSSSDEVSVADLKLFTTADALQLTLLPLTREILENRYIR